MAIAVVVRVYFVFFFLGLERDYIGNVFSDAYYYDAVATALLDDPLSYTSALHPPLYSLFVAFAYLVFGRGFIGVGLIQIAIDLASLVLFRRLCAEVVGRRFAGACGLVYAVYPDMVYFTGQLLPSSLFIFLLLLTVVILYFLYSKPRIGTAVAAAASLGFSVLAWGGAAALVPFLPVWLWITRGWRNGTKYALVMLLAFAAVLTPWVIRNYVVWNAFIPVSTGTAGAFAAGNSAESDGRYYDRYDLYKNAAHPEENEYERSRALTRKTLSWIFKNPVDFIKKIPDKLYYTYYWKLETASTPGRRPPIYDIIPFFSYGIFIPAVVGGLMISAREAKKFSLIYFVLLSQVVVVIIFFGHTKLRSQVMHYYILFGVLFFYWATRLLKGYFERKAAAAAQVG